MFEMIVRKLFEIAEAYMADDDPLVQSIGQYLMVLCVAADKGDLKALYEHMNAFTLPRVQAEMGNARIMQDHEQCDVCPSKHGCLTKDSMQSLRRQFALCEPVWEPDLDGLKYRLN